MPRFKPFWPVCLLLFTAIGYLHAQDQPAAPKPDFKLFFEKTYLHTDRDIYAPGDTVWFKAYLTDAQTGQLTGSSGSLHVDLVTPDAKIISTELIKLTGGLGNADISLPDSLAGGTYRLRAYTNWMRNFGDNFIFEKQIIILNDKTAAAIPNASAVTTKTVTAAVKTATPTTTATTFATINFYPEGGSLIEGISSIVGVKNEAEKPVPGIIISSAGDTVTRFTCDNFGFSRFALLPLKGQYYRAVVGGHPYPLPLALSNGLALQIRQTDTTIRAIVSCGGSASTNVEIKLTHAGATLITRHLELKDAQTVFNIITAGLPGGISALTVYDDQDRPQCERLVYIHSTASVATIKYDKTTYSAKEKVTLNIIAEPNSNLSLAAVDAAATLPQPGDIVSHQLLSSDLRGDVAQPGRFFDTTNRDRFKQLDLLLLTQGWRDFIWRRLEDTSIRISYATERGISIPGKLRDEVSNKYLTGANITLFADAAMGNKTLFSGTEPGGRFNFDGLDFYGKQNVRLAAVDIKGRRQGLITLDTVAPPPVKPAIKRTPENTVSIAKVSNQVRQKSSFNKSPLKRNAQLKEVKVSARKQNVVIPDLGAMTTWWPDQLFNISPKDYQYKPLEWFLLQNTKGATQGLTVNITGVVYPGKNQLLAIRGMIPPLIIINGHELNMLDEVLAEEYRLKYMNMPINKFKSVNLRRMIGRLSMIKPPDINDPNSKALGFEADLQDFYLLELTLDESQSMDNPGALSTDITGYYQSRTFYQPPPGAKESPVDYRSTVFWQPDIKTDATGKATISFYNGAVSGPIKILVQGIGAGGKPLSATSQYNIN